MTSDFVSEEDGLLRYSDAVWDTKKNLPEVVEEIKTSSEERVRRAGRVLSVSKDGYYHSELYLGTASPG